MADILKIINNLNHPLDKYPEFKEYIGNKNKQEFLKDAYIMPKCPNGYGLIEPFNNCWHYTCTECWKIALKDIDW